MRFNLSRGRLMNENVDPARVEVRPQSPLAAPVAPHDAPASPPVPPTPPKGRRLVRWLWVLAIAVVCVLAWQHFENIAPTPDTAPKGGRGAGAGGGPQTIRDAEAVTGDIPLYVDALGTVTSLATVTVRTQIAGNLQQIGFEEGQMVKAGDFLAQIDSRPYQATLAQAKGQLAKDTALHAQAEADLARYVTLSKQDSIAHQQVDDQTFLVAQDLAAMATDQAQIDAANLNITYTRIVAPISGRIGLRQVDQGNYVQVSDANGIVVITQISPISVIFSTPEDNLPQIAARLKSAASLPVTVLDRANVKQLATGTLTTTDNQIDTTTGTFKLRATFANDDGALFPNQFVNVRLLVDTLAGAVLVPNAAIQLGPNGNFVYVVKDDDTVTVRAVKIGPADSGRTSIASGVAVGEKVVIDGADRLREGAKVNLRNTPPGGAAANPDAAGAAAKPDAGGAAPAQSGAGAGSGDAAQPEQGDQRQHKHRHNQDSGAPSGASPAQ
jgi:membrane fusion protein, multidrug efflux system